MQLILLKPEPLSTFILGRRKPTFQWAIVLRPTSLLQPIRKLPDKVAYLIRVSIVNRIIDGLMEEIPTILHQHTSINDLPLIFCEAFCLLRPGKGEC